MSALLTAVSRVAPHALRTAGKQRLSILIYHRVVMSPDALLPDEPTVEQFRWQMRILRRYFNPLPLTEAVDRLAVGELPERAVCVTFDDGYADNEQLALPVLREEGVPATVFVSTGFLNGGRMFNDTIIETLRQYPGDTLDLRDIALEEYPVASDTQRLHTIAKILTDIRYREPAERAAAVAHIEAMVSTADTDLMMTDEQVRKLAASGVSIGAHTVNHPILASVDERTAADEIRASRDYLENLLQQPVTEFAYPNGRPQQDYTPVHREQVCELGFRTAVSTHWGVGTAASDRYQLPRFTPWDRTPLRFCTRLLLNYRNVDPLIDAGM